MLTGQLFFGPNLRECCYQRSFGLVLVTVGRHGVGVQVSHSHAIKVSCCEAKRGKLFRTLTEETEVIEDVIKEEETDMDCINATDTDLGGALC